MLESARAWLARRIAPAARVQTRRFDGARVDRLASDWAAETRGINEELRSDLNRLRQRCRSLVNNNDYARKFRSMCQANIVGPSGIRLQARAADVRSGLLVPDRLANTAIESAWAEWSRGCDVTGRMGLRELLESLVGGLPSDGEFLVRLVRGAASGNRFGLALQAIDVERIDTLYNVAATRSSNAVIMGVEVDSVRRPVAVHLFAAHPHDGVWSSRDRIRVPAGELLHVFRAERPEQMRGIPWMAPGVLSLHHLSKFDLAALLAAEHGANLLGFFQTPDGIAPVGSDADGEQITVSQPGTYDVLPPGVTFAQHDSKYPSETYGAFHKAHLQRIASGWGIAYHSLANDLENVNFSSIRSGTLEERDRWAADQEWLISAFLRPVFLEWLRMGLLMGAITMPNGSALPAAKYDKFARHQWQPRRWDWVDPKSDVEAAILKVRAGLVSPQDVAAAMGYDFEDVLQSIADAQRMADEFGVRLTAYDATPGAAPADQSASQSQIANDSARGVEQMVRDLKDEIARSPKPQQPVNVSVGISSEQVAEVMRGIAETAERTLGLIRKDIQEMPIVIPAPSVVVEAVMPEVRAEAPVVNVVNQVQPAGVTVVDNHPKRSVQVVQRDSKDEIVQTVTTYER